MLLQLKESSSGTSEPRYRNVGCCLQTSGGGVAKSVQVPSYPDSAVTARRVELGDQLRDARRAAGLTQEEVALRSGLDRPSLVRIERGQQDPRLSTLIRIERAIGITLHLVKSDHG